MSEIIEIAGSTMLWAMLATVCVMLPGIPFAYLLARRDFPGKRVLSTLTSLPMVLPPTAAGYLLLKLLADRGPLGRDTLGFDLNIILTWKAVVLACALMSMPLIIRTARMAFEGVNPRLEAMARTLGFSRRQAFLRITLPLASKGLLAAFILGFTRSMGEFGATVMVAGNIPGRTQTLASAIYSAQQSGQTERANILLLLSLLLGFAAIFTTEWLIRPGRREPARSS